MNPNVTSWQDTQKLLAFIVVVGYLIVIFVWLICPPHGNETTLAVLNTLIGALSGFTGMVITFYFGSSRSAANKDETIKQLSLQAPPPAPTPAPPPA